MLVIFRNNKLFSQISENQLEERTGVPFEEIIPDCMFAIETQMPRHHLTADLARDLLKKMLVIDPEHRITVDNALNHPFVSLWKTVRILGIQNLEILPMKEQSI